MARVSGRVAPAAPRVSAELAASILAFLSADDQRFERFVGLTGVAVGDLRTASRSAGFGESLLDYLSSDEALLVAFAAQHGCDPSELARLRDAIAAAHDAA